MDRFILFRRSFIHPSLRNRINLIMVKFSSAQWFTPGLLILALTFVAFHYYQNTGLDEPAAVSAYLNDVFPTKIVTDVEVASIEVPTDRALAITPEPLGDRVFVAEQVGRIYTFTVDENGLANRTLFMDARNQVFSGQDSGMLGLAFHPEYNQTGSPNHNYFYVFYTAIVDGNHFLRISRFSGTQTGDLGSELVMLEQELGPTLHRGGGLLFGNDGFLYVAIGDLGYMEQSQNVDEMLAGGILRIDVDMQGGSVSHPPRRTLSDVGKGFSGVGYYIPSDNPFLDTNGGLFEEYYTLGSRNPHRMTVDRETGTIYIGNAGSNGENIREEVNILEKGGNYGWPFREGTIDHPEYMARPSEIFGSNLVDPIHEYPKAEGNCAVIGGYVYRGSQLPSLYGKYIFADYCGKKIWAMDVDQGPVTEKEELTLVPFNPYTLGEDANGELYIGVEGWNPIYKLKKSEGGQGKSIPQLISQTGAFSDLATLTPAPGVIPYDITAPLWSDGAAKFRWVAIPNDGTHDTPTEKITFSEEEDWSFPQGTVFVKHFEIALDEANPSVTRRLETRFLVHGEDGIYYAFTYRWNESETDATLIQQGETEVLTIKNAQGSTRFQPWYYPGQSDCLACHTTAAGYVLGPKTRQLNSDMLYPVTGRIGNQVESLNHIGAFSPAVDINNLPNVLTSRHIADENASLEDRVRSYLDSNCAGCHRPGGGTRSTIDLRLQVDLASSGLINGETIDALGIEGAKIIVPGSPEKSILYHRLIQLNNSQAMPPLAKNKLDDEALAVIEQWINDLGGNSGTDIEEEGPALPALATLHTNYPNPFSSSTNISYELAREGHVNVTLYDIQGRAVRTLVDTFQPAGFQTTTLDAENLPSGTYVYEIQTRGWRSSKKLLLVR